MGIMKSQRAQMTHSSPIFVSTLMLAFSEKKKGPIHPSKGHLFFDPQPLL
jgi:hypothetical protein